MPQQNKIPDYAIPVDDDIPDYATPIDEEEVEEPGLFDRAADSIGNFLNENPRIREIGQRFLTGTSPEFEKMLKERGISRVIGTPESENSILPQSGQAEDYWGGFFRSLYEDFVRPAATPSGIAGSSESRFARIKPSRLPQPNTGGRALPPSSVRQPIALLPEGRGTTFIAGEANNPNASVMGTTRFANSSRDVPPYVASFVSGENAPVRSQPAGRFIDLDELAEAERQAALYFTNVEQQGGRRMNVPDPPAMSTPVAPRDTRLGFEETSRAELDYPLNITPEALRPRSIQTVTAELTPESIKAGSVSRQPTTPPALPREKTAREALAGIANRFKTDESGEFDPKQLLDNIIGLATFRDTRKSLAANQNVRRQIDELIRAREGTKPDTAISRFLKDESGAVRLPDQKTVDSIKEQISRALRSGGRIDLESIFNRAKTTANVTRGQFNKVVDDIIKSGTASEGPKSVRNTRNPTQEIRTKLIDAIRANKPLRAEQDLLRKEEVGRRFRGAAAVKTSGIKGAKEALGKMRGEYEKLEGVGVEMDQKDLNSLFDAIKNTRYITEGDRMHARTGLFKIINGGEVPQPSELSILDEVFGGGFADEIRELHGGLGVVSGIKIAKTANTMKAMMSSWDLSAPLRQGLPLIHRPEFREAFQEMFKYATSDEAFKTAMKAIQERPKYLLGRENGLFIADTGSLMKGEEAFMNSYLHDLSKTGRFGKAATTPFRVSERAYVGFLNKLRADTFDNMIDQAVKLGHKPEHVARDIANFVNTATGRGSLGSLERYGTALNNFLFSPRLLASRVQMLSNPKLYTSLPKGMRREGLKSLGAMAGFQATVLGISALAGAKISTDILSGDFLKARFGERTLDPGGGFNQVIRAGHNIPYYTANPTSGAFPRTGFSRAEDFAASKLSPAASLVYQYLNTKMDDGERVNKYGEPIDLRVETMRRFVPIFLQDVYELSQSEPEIARDVLLGAAAFFGMGTQTYPERNSNPQRRRGLGIGRPRLNIGLN